LTAPAEKAFTLGPSGFPPKGFSMPADPAAQTRPRAGAARPAHDGPAAAGLQSAADRSDAAEVQCHFHDPASLQNGPRSTGAANLWAGFLPARGLGHRPEAGIRRFAAPAVPAIATISDGNGILLLKFIFQ
jgi:hypothetical protein